MRIKIGNRYRKFAYIGSAFSFFIFLLGLALDDLNVQWVAILIMFTVSLIFAFTDKKDGLAYIAFLIAFFTFLLGLNTFVMLSGDNWYAGYKYHVANVICNNIFLSLSVLFWSYTFYRERKKRKKLSSIEQFDGYAQRNHHVFEKSRQLFYISLPFCLAINLEKANFGLTHIYGTGNFVSSFPWIFQKLALITAIAYIISLAALPSHKEILPMTWLFLGCSLLQMLSGDRGRTVRDFLMVFFYFVFRQGLSRRLNRDEVWIKTWEKVLLIACVPFVLAFLGVYAYIRHGESIQMGVGSGIIVFFKQQGGSIFNISRYELMRDHMPTGNISFVFGPVINIFRESLLGKMLGLESYVGQTVDAAMHGNNLGNTLTFLFAKEYYLAGGGFGTQYIAELYADFSYIGVIIYHVFLGWLLSTIKFVSNRHWLVNTLFILIIRDIMFLPRDFCLNFIGSLLSTTYWVVFLYVEYGPKIRSASIEKYNTIA